MNHYNFEDCFVGQTVSICVRISEDKMNMFGQITGDCNPLHSDDKYAKEHNFKGRVAYGLLTSSFTSTLAGVYIPGERSLIHEVLYKYMKPVFVGDELIVRGEVNELDERDRRISLRIKVRRTNDNTLVMRGHMIIGFLEDS